MTDAQFAKMFAGTSAYIGLALSSFFLFVFIINFSVETKIAWAGQTAILQIASVVAVPKAVAAAPVAPGASAVFAVPAASSSVAVLPAGSPYGEAPDIAGMMASVAAAPWYAAVDSLSEILYAVGV